MKLYETCSFYQITIQLQDCLNVNLLRVTLLKGTHTLDIFRSTHSHLVI